MTSEPPQKRFDCVQFTRRQRERRARDTEGMSFEEIRDYTDNRLLLPDDDILKEIADKMRTRQPRRNIAFDVVESGNGGYEAYSRVLCRSVRATDREGLERAAQTLARERFDESNTPELTVTLRQAPWTSAAQAKKGETSDSSQQPGERRSA